MGLRPSTDKLQALSCYQQLEWRLRCISSTDQKGNGQRWEEGTSRLNGLGRRTILTSL